MRQVLPILVFLSLVLRATSAEDIPTPPKPGTFTLEMTVDGHSRVAHVHVPRGYRAGTRPPLVVAFHGAGGDGLQMIDKNGWIAKSDREGFLLVGPTGLPAVPRLGADFKLNPRVWNSGQLNPRSPRTRIDDVVYTAKLLDALQKRVPYDEKRVFVTGHSNGAGMTFLLGTRMPERFVALAPVSGMLAVKDPKPSRPLPTLYIIGTKDPLQPLEGGPVKLPWGDRTNEPVSTYLTAWAGAIGCATEGKAVSDAKGVKKVVYPSKTGGPTLTVLYVENHGHGWPGGQSPLLLRAALGPASKSLDATDAIWDFFEQAAEPTRSK